MEVCAGMRWKFSRMCNLEGGSGWGGKYEYGMLSYIHETQPLLTVILVSQGSIG
jgi:hypothetical protein